MAELFEFGWFTSHAGLHLPFKIDCDALTDDTLRGIAKMLRWKFAFSEVHAVPSDETLPRTPAGPRLARILREEFTLVAGYPPLIVDDVLTTGMSMEEARTEVMRDRPSVMAPIGFVIVSRAPQDGAAVSQPTWVHALMRVEQWAQSPATGIG